MPNKRKDTGRAKFPTVDERLMTLEQVANWLYVSPSTIYRWEQDEMMPRRICLGDPNDPKAARRFLKKELDEWLMSRPRGAGRLPEELRPSLGHGKAKSSSEAED